jgi:hypothetical protein
VVEGMYSQRSSRLELSNELFTSAVTNSGESLHKTNIPLITMNMNNPSLDIMQTMALFLHFGRESLGIYFVYCVFDTSHEKDDV